MRICFLHAPFLTCCATDNGPAAPTSAHARRYVAMIPYNVWQVDDANQDA